jgi:hypothetical protein
VPNEPEDAIWRTELDRVKEVLQTHIHHLEQATKQDLAKLRTDLTAHIDARSDDLVERMRDMQSEVLRAFHNWARPVDVKLRSHEERLMLLEERVSGLERGDLPPRS